MKLLTIEQAAESLAVSRATTQRLIDSGRIPAVTICTGKRKRLQRVDESDLAKFLESLKTGQKDQQRADSKKLRAI